MKTRTQDVINVVDAVRDYVAVKAPELPEGLGVPVSADEA